MEHIALTTLVDQHLQQAHDSAAGRSAATLYGGHEQVLRHTLIALRAGSELSEHNSPGEATLYVLRGRVRLTSEGDAAEGTAGDLMVIPQARHGLEALEDAAVLLSVAKAEVVE